MCASLPPCSVSVSMPACVRACLFIVCVSVCLCVCVCVCHCTGEYHRDLPRAGPSYTIRGKAREESPTRSVSAHITAPHIQSRQNQQHAWSIRFFDCALWRTRCTWDCIDVCVCVFVCVCVMSQVGPGEYEPHDPSLPSAPVYTIATRPLDRQHEDDAPGM